MSAEATRSATFHLRRMHCDDHALLLQWYRHPTISSVLLDEECDDSEIARSLTDLCDSDLIADGEGGFVLELCAQPVGFVHIMWVNWLSRTAEVDFFLDPFISRPFVAIQAVRKIAELAFDQLNLRKLYGFIYGFNSCSLKLLGAWMNTEACLRQYLKRRGTFEDVYILSIMNSDYLSIKDKRISRWGRSQTQ